MLFLQIQRYRPAGISDKLHEPYKQRVLLWLMHRYLTSEENQQVPTYREILASCRIPFPSVSSWSCSFLGSVCRTFYSSFINDFGSYTLQQLVMIRSTIWAGFFSLSSLIVFSSQKLCHMYLFVESHTIVQYKSNSAKQSCHDPSSCTEECTYYWQTLTLILGFLGER